jgi:CDGSH-type Zn-finger protein
MEENKTGDSVKLQVIENGPLNLNGKIEIIYPSGENEQKDGQIFLCRCGGSSNKPFCDGTHNKIGFKG